MYEYKAEIREAHGRNWTIRWFHDSDHGAPWEEWDGHGPVSDWERREKRPGEMILAEDRGFKRFYDFAEAVKVARRDGWNCAPYNWDTKGAQAAAAAMRDFEVLYGWCNDHWHYCGIVVTCEDECDVSASLWGIEDGLDGSAEYHLEVIEELMQECLLDINRQTYAGFSVGI